MYIKYFVIFLFISKNMFHSHLIETTFYVNASLKLYCLAIIFVGFCIWVFLSALFHPFRLPFLFKKMQFFHSLDNSMILFFAFSFLASKTKQIEGKIAAKLARREQKNCSINIFYIKSNFCHERSLFFGLAFCCIYCTNWRCKFGDLLWFRGGKSELIRNYWFYIEY